MARAGWCGGCGSYVYLTTDGSCPVGHGPELISQHYEAPDPPGEPVAVALETEPAPASVETEPAPAAVGSIADIIAEASRLADEHVTVERVGESFVVQSDSLSAGRIVEALDRALALAPGDIDLLLAKSDMLALGMQFKTSEDVLDDILARDPGNFEARTRKEHWGEWSNVFTLPHWSEDTAVLPASMAQDLANARSVQLVRSGVTAVPVIARPVQPGEMASGLGPQTRVLWEPVWSATAAGAIVAHYLIVEDDPSDPYRAEAFLPVHRSEKAARMNGYWLLRQLAHAEGAYVVLAEGTRVVYNRWYPFPPTVRAHLAAMESHLDGGAAVSDPTTFRDAMQWHMNHFDMNQVSFDHPLSDAAAGVAGFSMPVAEPQGAPSPEPEPEPAPAPEPTPAPEPAAAPAPEPAAAPAPEPAPIPAPAVEASAPAAESGADLATVVLGDADALLGDAALLPPARALLLLNLSQVAEAVAPERVEAYWSQLLQVKTALPVDRAADYKQLAEEFGEATGKGDSGFIAGLLTQVASARARVAADRDGAVRELVAVEQQLGERKMPFGKKRVYGALADAWLDIDRAQAIRLFEHSSADANDGRIVRMHAAAPLSQDEWRMLGAVLKPATAAKLAAAVLRAQDARVNLPAEFVEATGKVLLSGIVRYTDPALPIPERLNTHERLVASLAEQGRCDEAWAEVERVFRWATTAVVTVFGDWFTQLAVVGRAINEAVNHRCVSEEQFSARVEEAPVIFQAYARAMWRAKNMSPGNVAAGFDRLVWELSPATLQRPTGYRMTHGGDPAKMADRGHREAAYTYYFMTAATGGFAQEVLDVTAERGLTAARDAVVRTLLSSGDASAIALLPPEQFAEDSIERFLALGTAEKRAEHLARLTGNGAHTIPGCLWRNTEAAQAMPQIRTGGAFSKTTEPRPETVVEYCEHNPVYRTYSTQLPLQEQFPEWVRVQGEYESSTIDAALIPALLAWSERDWEPARQAMIHMWEAMKPTDVLLMADVVRTSIIKRACTVLAVDPEVLGTYVLTWLHEELVKKGRQWTQGNTQITLRLTDTNLAALCIDAGIALADIAPARRDRVVEIALGYAGTSVEVVRAFAQIYMVGREPRMTPPPAALHKNVESPWQEGVITSIVNEMRKRLMLAALLASVGESAPQ